jgi:hypothetical protein
MLSDLRLKSLLSPLIALQPCQAHGPGTCCCLRADPSSTQLARGLPRLITSTSRH